MVAIKAVGGFVEGVHDDTTNGGRAVENYGAGTSEGVQNEPGSQFLSLGAGVHGEASEK